MKTEIEAEKCSLENAHRLGCMETVLDTKELTIMEDKEQTLPIFIHGTSQKQLEEWLRQNASRLKKRSSLLFQVRNRQLADIICAAFDFVCEPCSEWIWPKNRKPPVSSRIFLKKACKDDLSFLTSLYSLLSPEEIRKALQEGRIWMAPRRADGAVIGFAGMHAEGSMGMLYVCKQYRRQGFGQDIEMALVEKFLDLDLIPYCHVFEENKSSISLQQKAGMQKADSTVCWCAPTRYPGF